MSNEEFEKYSKKFNSEKIVGRYIHFGHIMDDFIEKSTFCFADFYVEIYKAHKATLANFYDHKTNFKHLKEYMVKSLEYLTEKIKEVTPKIVKKEAHEALEHVKENYDDLMKKFGANGKTYFT